MSKSPAYSETRISIDAANKVMRVVILAALLLAPQVTYSQRRVSSIRSVDFANFTYRLPDGPNTEDYVTLRGGKRPQARNKKGEIIEDEMSLGEITYGDVTGDGVEEAIIYLDIVTGGSAAPGVIYIYTLRSGKPKLLWSFYTGDRADGGLHQVYADKGRLVVELNEACA
jgi:hypothetical protein